jgi:hypothetical protein
LIVLMSCLLTDLLRYVMIVSIPDTINHQGLERKLILKKTCGEVLNLKFKRLLPVNGYDSFSINHYQWFTILSRQLSNVQLSINELIKSAINGSYQKIRERTTRFLPQ